MASGSPSHGVNTHSPTPSHASSSFSELTVPSNSSDEHTEVFDELSSEDEVVWTGNDIDSEDFVLIPLSRPTGVSPDTDVHADALAHLSLVDLTTPTPTHSTTHVQGSPKPSRSKHADKGRRSAGSRSERSALTPASNAPVAAPKSRRRRGKRDAAASYPSPSPSPVRKRAESPLFEEGEGGFGGRLLVEESDDNEPAVERYEDAVQYINSFLSSPTAALSCSACTRLMFLQSLIIELGLVAPTSALPPSLSAAKRLLKTRAFVNIGTYLSVRGQGVEQLRAIMFNNRRELASDLRRRRGARKADKGWVKRHGLSVLLVSVF